ncbi:helix-turn-helix domain containing protein [Bacillus cereus]|uniref:helix-turn-helix domain-containing protein n=1 Tax=Bacillus cereus TaxID=1396 RepID=UPI00211D3515|nr:helix-turn-helix domain containing protein [Bacillus cereus]
MIKNIVQNTATIRKIHILEALNESDRIISSDELADQLQCTARTIKNDISQIKQNLPKNWRLLGVSSKGYVLKKKPEDTISHAIAPYLKQSEVYNIIQGIYDHKKYTLVKWSQLLYLDKLTLKKILNKFTKTLNDFELNFNFRTLQLVGEELNIRYFYIVLLYTMQKYKKTTHLHPNLQNKIERIIESYGFGVDLHVLTIIISVFIKRTIDKHFITKEINEDFIFSSNKLRCVESIVLEIEKFYKFKLHQNEKQFLLQALFLTSEGDIEEKRDITNYYWESHKNMYIEYDSIMETFSDLFKLDSRVKESIQYNFYFQMYKIHILKYHKLSTEYLLDQYKDLYVYNPELKKIYSVIAPLIISCNKKLVKNKLTEGELQYIVFNMACNMHLHTKKKSFIAFVWTNSLEKNYIQ